MTWAYQKMRWGNHEVLVWREPNGLVYTVEWSNKRAITTVGGGSENKELHNARHTAVFHLANILPKRQGERLLSQQSELLWEPWFKPRKRRSSR